MAAKEHLPEGEILATKRLIFNKLCAAYLRGKNSDRVDADELRRELNIPGEIFAAALSGFLSAENQVAVEVLKDKSRTYLKLGETGRDICSDWNAKKKPTNLGNIEPPVDISVGGFIRRSA